MLDKRVPVPVQPVSSDLKTSDSEPDSGVNPEGNQTIINPPVEESPEK